MKPRHLFLTFIICTIYNVLFDWLFNRLGACTIAWEGGALTTLTTVWVVGLWVEVEKLSRRSQCDVRDAVKRALNKS